MSRITVQVGIGVPATHFHILPLPESFRGSVDTLRVWSDNSRWLDQRPLFSQAWRRHPVPLLERLPRSLIYFTPSNRSGEQKNCGLRRLRLRHWSALLPRGPIALLPPVIVVSLRRLHRPPFRRPPPRPPSRLEILAASIGHGHHFAWLNRGVGNWKGSCACHRENILPYSRSDRWNRRFRENTLKLPFLSYKHNNHLTHFSSYFHL